MQTRKKAFRVKSFANLDFLISLIRISWRKKYGSLDFILVGGGLFILSFLVTVFSLLSIPLRRYEQSADAGGIWSILYLLLFSLMSNLGKAYYLLPIFVIWSGCFRSRKNEELNAIPISNGELLFGEIVTCFGLGSMIFVGFFCADSIIGPIVSSGSNVPNAAYGFSSVVLSSALSPLVWGYSDDAFLIGVLSQVMLTVVGLALSVATAIACREIVILLEFFESIRGRSVSPMSLFAGSILWYCSIILIYDALYDSIKNERLYFAGEIRAAGWTPMDLFIYSDLEVLAGIGLLLLVSSTLFFILHRLNSRLLFSGMPAI